MLRTCRQLVLRSLVALATIGIAVPTLFASPCACGSKRAVEKQELRPCCAKRLAAVCCQAPDSAADDCCSGGSPCECPGCQCSLHSPDAVAASAAMTIPHFLPLALPATFAAADAERSSLAAHAERFLLQSPPVPLRALYCVWII
ncbi:MAG: hypothetical protein WD851_05950 [Pirellulales bacterium]